MEPFLTSLATVIGTLALSCLSCDAQQTTITTPPSSVNSSANREVTFDCAAENANLFFWYWNNTYVKYISDLITDVETDPNASPPRSVLSIWIPQNYSHLNRSWIKCKAANYTPGAESAPAESAEALLLIQGPLGPTSHLRALPLCETGMINVSWNRPYTLKGITIPSYIICIAGDCSRIENDVQSATIPFPSFTDRSFSEKYLLCIQAHDCSSDNFSESSCINVTLNEVPNSIQYDDVQRTLTFTSNVYQVEFDISLEEKNFCRWPQNYSIIVTYSNGTNVTLHPSVIDQTITTASFVVPLEEQMKEMSINIKIVSTNSAGSNISDSIHFDLFHVEDAYAVGNNITCRFLEGSNAQGCSTTLICVNDTTEASVATCTISRVSQADKEAFGSFVCQGNPPNCTSYNVLVYDIYSDGTVSNQEAKVLCDVTVSPQPNSHSGFDYWWLTLPSSLVLFCISAGVVAVIIYRYRRRPRTIQLHPLTNEKDDDKNK